MLLLLTAGVAIVSSGYRRVVNRSSRARAVALSQASSPAGIDHRVCDARVLQRMQASETCSAHVRWAAPI